MALETEHQHFVVEVERLKRHVRSTRRMAAVAIVVPCALVAIAASGVGNADQVLEVVRARRLEIVAEPPANGEEGAKVVVELSSLNGLGVLKLQSTGSGGGFLATPATLAILGPSGDAVEVRPEPSSGKLQFLMHEGNKLGPRIMLGRLPTESTYFITVAGRGFDGTASLWASEDGDTSVKVYNKTNEAACTLSVDEYGNGEVGAWNRKGSGRTLTPGN